MSVDVRCLTVQNVPAPAALGLLHIQKQLQRARLVGATVDEAASRSLRVLARLLSILRDPEATIMAVDYHHLPGGVLEFENAEVPGFLSSLEVVAWLRQQQHFLQSSELLRARRVHSVSALLPRRALLTLEQSLAAKRFRVRDHLLLSAVATALWVERMARTKRLVVADILVEKAAWHGLAPNTRGSIPMSFFKELPYVWFEAIDR